MKPPIIWSLWVLLTRNRKQRKINKITLASLNDDDADDDSRTSRRFSLATLMLHMNDSHRIVSYSSAASDFINHSIHRSFQQTWSIIQRFIPSNLLIFILEDCLSVFSHRDRRERKRRLLDNQWFLTRRYLILHFSPSGWELQKMFHVVFLVVVRVSYQQTDLSKACFKLGQLHVRSLKTSVNPLYVRHRSSQAHLHNTRESQNLSHEFAPYWQIRYGLKLEGFAYIVG